MLNSRVLPFFAEQGVSMLPILTDLGTDCGKLEQHDYQLYLVMNDIEHTKIKAQSPLTNSIYERFHKTILQEFYQVTFRKKLYQTKEKLRQDLDVRIAHYNHERPHQGNMCCGRTPMETFRYGKQIWQAKLIN